MRIVVITQTRNEETIIGFFISHYQDFADHIVVYDGQSEDATRRIVQKMSRRCCTTEVREGYPPPLDDETSIKVKNTAYKSFQADWFIVVDCDEFIYHPDLRGLLEYYDKRGVTLPRVNGYDMIGDAVPIDGELIDQIQDGVPNHIHESKFAVFKPSVDINYNPGAHTLNPRGEVVLSETAEIMLLHYKWLSREYVKHKAETCVMSEMNHLKHYGYTKSLIPSMQDWVRQYDELRAKRVKVLP